MTLAALQAEVARRGLPPIDVDVEGGDEAVLVRIWCDVDGERLLSQTVVPRAEVTAAKDELAGIFLRWLAIG